MMKVAVSGASGCAGSQIVRELPYMILVEALRLHLDASRGVGWLSALADRQVGAAITVIHLEPAQRWSVATLAAEVGMFRPRFAARFRQCPATARSNI
jgi:AraC-like DNA-binding protein